MHTHTHTQTSPSCDDLGYESFPSLVLRVRGLLSALASLRLSFHSDQIRGDPDGLSNFQTNDALWRNLGSQQQQQQQQLPLKKSTQINFPQQGGKYQVTGLPPPIFMRANILRALLGTALSDGGFMVQRRSTNRRRCHQSLGSIVVDHRSSWIMVADTSHGVGLAATSS